MRRNDTTDQLRRLRKLMADRGLDVYVIPSEDAHFSEYTALSDARRAFITGFTGSAGIAMVSTERAAVAVGSRYHIQASNQLDDNWTLLKNGLPGAPTWADWIAQEAENGKIVGIDPTVISSGDAQMLTSKIKSKGGRDLVFIPENLVDQVWGSARPPIPSSAIKVLHLEYAGKSWQTKIEELRSELYNNDAAGIVVSMLDEVAWLFNLRGSDIPYNPVFFAYALITPSTATLYIAMSKVDDVILGHLQGVVIRPYNTIFSDLIDVVQAGKGAETTGRKFMVSPCISWALFSALGGANTLKMQSPIANAKAIKNTTEVEGLRKSHVRDGAAMSEFFAWLEEKLIVENMSISELEASHKLEEIRQSKDRFVGLSFRTISSAGSNAAIMHYKPEQDDCSDISLDAIYLCDSGAQYYDGTTDVTRTVHFGNPTSEEKKAYTLVLKGHIALDQIVFPEGTSGLAVDILARQYLWQHGMDYSHATGHGVGSFLNVHEGPIGIGRANRLAGLPLHIGNVLSNEPGYYEENKFGVRIENMLVVQDAGTRCRFAGKSAYRFEHLTVVPMCRRLIDLALLTQSEKLWLDAYHQKVMNSTAEFFVDDERTMRWLARECKPYSECDQ